MAAISDSLPKLTYTQQQGTAQFFNESLADHLALKMMLIPAGTFMMGSPEEELERMDREGPQHEVSVAAFCVGKYPVTQAQWQFVAGLPQAERELEANPSRFKGDTHPVESVSWYDAVEFCVRLSTYTKRMYRLPSEAEWEYACRARTTTPFYFGETITTDVANYDETDDKDGRWSGSYGQGHKGEYRKETTPVEHFENANAFGLCDMHGNVYEWCQDHWHSSYEGTPIDGSAWLSKDEDTDRVRRGGSWYYNPRHCRSAYRSSTNPRETNYDIGFRVVCSAQTGKYPRSDNLRSEKNIDYTNLRDLLATGKWKEADKETWKVMMQVTEQEKRGYLYAGDISEIPATDLRTIDQLWVKYSSGKFGFSVQKQIWYEVNQNWQEFTTRVGWKVPYAAFTFSLNAPIGHLPFQFGTPDQSWVWGPLGFGSRMDYLLSRQDIQI